MNPWQKGTARFELFGLAGIRVNMIVVCELFYLFKVRHFTANAFRREALTGNPMARLAGSILIVLQLRLTCAPPMQHLLRNEALDALSRAAIVGLGVTVFLAVEMEKMLLRRARVRRV